jgi:Ca2+-binding RTX toxin-like protein
MRRNKFNKIRKIERLEDRKMMAGDISFSDGVLTITGDTLDDQAEIRVFQDGNEADDFKVRVDLFVTDPDADDPNDLIDEHNDEKEIQDVQKIVFNGGDGNDTLTVFVNGVQSELLAAEGIVLEFNGEGGDDTLDNTDAQGGIDTTALGGAGIDTLEGGRFDDTFDGGVGNDVLTGGRGNDTYEFDGLNLGTDEIHEAANVDTDKLDFTNFESFVSVDLEQVFSANDPNFAVTAFMSNTKVKLFNATGIEDVTGSASTDTIRGNSRPNYFLGGGEDDRLAGRGGNDILEGEAGNDTYEFAGTNLGTDDVKEDANTGEDRLRFSGMSTGLTIDISKAGSEFAVDTADLRVRLSDATAIETVFGTHYGDKIIGNSRNNTLKGLGGNDTILGLGGGADTLDGGADNDTIRSDALDEVFGGTGRDIFDGFVEFFFTSPPRARYLDWGLF